MTLLALGTAAPSDSLEMAKADTRAKDIVGRVMEENGSEATSMSAGAANIKPAHLSAQLDVLS